MHRGQAAHAAGLAIELLGWGGINPATSTIDLHPYSCPPAN